MLGFDMETRRINDIITAGANTKLTDKAFLEKEIRKFLGSRARRMMIKGDMYYDYEQAIKNKARMVIGEDGTLTEDKNLPNNKFCDNDYAIMVDQKVNYIFSKPITFKTEDGKYEKALNDVFNKGFMRTLKNLAKDSYNGGIAWLYPYYDENGAFKIKRFHPWEILPFWKDEDHTELDFAVRVYSVLAYEGELEKELTFVEVYDTQGIHRFEYQNSQLVPDYSTNYFEHINEDGSVVAYNWNKVPLIPFKSNENETPLIKKCKCLQDGINQLLSEYGDGLQENASGNSILVIHNYGGTNLGEFRRNLMTYKAVKVNSVDGSSGGIDTLQIEVNSENYKVILSELHKAIIKNCKGYDIEELKSSGSPNEMTIKSVFSMIDMDANEIETEFQASFEQLLWFVNSHFANAGTGNFAESDIDVIFNRDMMINESQIIVDCQNSAGLISQRTIVANHPWTSNVDEELKQIEDERNEATAMDEIDMFGSNTEDGADNSEDE